MTTMDSSVNNTTSSSFPIVPDWFSGLPYHKWLPIPHVSPRPSPRYKHAAALVDHKLYISGGTHSNGRYLSDIQVFDLTTFVWSPLKPPSFIDPNTNAAAHQIQLFPPPISHHSMIQWGTKLLLLAGHSKSSNSTHVKVWFFDLETSHYGITDTSGNLPIARGGQSVTLVGSNKLIMFGGEDVTNQLLNDIHLLDLDTMTWNLVNTTHTPPSPRFDHAAAVYGERYLLVFGGCSHATCFNDLHVLDLQTMEWSQPQLQGDLVTPRAGHSGIAIEENWYIVGGGDNKSAAPDTLVLNMSKLTWSVITSVKERDPLASEGITICSALLDGENILIAFGGYNGKYNNEVLAMKPKPKDLSRPKILQSPAAAAAAASVTAAYALTKSGKLDFIETTADSNSTKLEKNDYSVESAATGEVKRVLEMSLEEVGKENLILRQKIECNRSSYAELSKELQSVQGQLITERSRCFNLEAQIAELQEMLSAMPSVEKEVQLLRKQKSEWEQQDIEIAQSVQKQGSGGVWRWIAGDS